MDSVRNQSSSRKDKALGLVATRFVEVYNQDDADVIGINQAAERLGVVKRRIYDIVIFFSSIGIVEKSRKNQFAWKGFGGLDRYLSELKDEGMKEKFANVPDGTKEIDEGTKEKFFFPDLNKPEMVIDEEDTEESFNLTDPDEQDNSTSPIPGNKKWKLARNIVKFFLCSDDDVTITIDDLTKALLIHESEYRYMKMKSMVRSLYDPINVFSSINLIEKTYSPENNTVAYRWIGPKPIADSSSIKKRASEVEVSSLSTKRNKTTSSYLEADATNFTNEPSTSAGSANENYEVIDVVPISIIKPPYFYNPGDGWIMINQNSEKDLRRFADSFRSSQKD